MAPQQPPHDAMARTNGAAGRHPLRSRRFLAVAFLAACLVAAAATAFTLSSRPTVPPRQPGQHRCLAIALRLAQRPRAHRPHRPHRLPRKCPPRRASPLPPGRRPRRRHPARRTRPVPRQHRTKPRVPSEACA
jgi:hypothetical protein